MRPRTPAFLAAAAFCLPLTQAEASDYDTSITTGFASRHIAAQREYRENNYGIGIEFGQRDGPWSYNFGFYQNSEDHGSVYVGAAWRPLVYGPIRLGVMFGAVTGYSRFPVSPMVSPNVEVRLGPVGIDIVGAPPIGGMAGVIAARLKYTF